MKILHLLAAGSVLAAAAAFTPAAAAPLSHSGLTAEADASGLIETVRHRGWRHGWRGHRYGWYGPPRRYGWRHRPYWDRPYYRRPYVAGPGFGIYFGTRPYYW